MSEGDRDDMVRVHGELVRMQNDLVSLWKGMAATVSTDTAFALGELTGLFGKARALLSRDIDGLRP